MLLKKLTSLVMTLHIIFIFFLISPPSPSRKRTSSVKIRTSLSPRNPSLTLRNPSSKSSSHTPLIKQGISSKPKEMSSPSQTANTSSPQVKKGAQTNPTASLTPSSQKKPGGASLPSSKTPASKPLLTPQVQKNTAAKPPRDSQKKPSLSLSSSSSIAKSPSSSPKVSEAHQKKVPKSSPSSHESAPSVIEPTSSSLTSFEAWKEIEEALAKIEEKSYPKTQTPSWGSSIAQVHDDMYSEEESSSSPHALFSHEGALSEEDLVVGFLYTSLHLPESGDVKVSLTLRADGTVKELKILNAESGKNRLYLEKNLPKLRFPIKKPEEKTWIFNFCHEV